MRTCLARFRRLARLTWPLEPGDRGKSWLCVLGLAALPFVVYWQVAAFRQISVAGDILDQYYPIQYLISEQIRQGQIPLWNNRMFSGIPLASHTGALYPLGFLSVLVPAWVALTYSLLVHFALSGIFTFLYLRTLGIGRRGAVIGGVTFMFCGFTVAHLGHQNMNHTVPWLPLILWALEKWRRAAALPGQGLKIRYLSIGALATGLMYLGGHPQIPVYATSLAAAYVLFFTLFPGGGESQGASISARGRFILGAVVMFALGLAIASPVVWDLYDMARAYRRPEQAGVGYDFFTVMSLPPWTLPSLVFPRLFERDIALVEMSGYVGILPLALAVLAGLRWRHRARPFFILAAAVAVLLVLGRYTPVYRVLYRIPVFNAFRIPPRNWYEFDFAIAVLAGAGFDYVARSVGPAMRRAARWGRAIAVVLLLTPVVLAGIARLTMPPQRLAGLLAPNGGSILANRAVWLPLVLVSASAAWLFFVAPRPGRRYGWLLAIALITSDLYFSFGGHLFASHATRRPPSEVFAEAFDRLPPAVQFLREDRSRYRIISYSPVLKFALDEKYNILSPNLHIPFGIDSADAYYGDTVPTQYAQFADNAFTGSAAGTLIAPRLFRPDHNTILNLLNVKYIVVPADRSLTPVNRLVVDGITLDAYPYSIMELGAASGLVSVTLDLPATPVTTLAIASVLRDSGAIADGTPVAKATLTAADGRKLEFTLVAGQHTAELSYDCTPSAMAHRRAPVAYDIPGQAGCLYHSYFAREELGQEPAAFRQLKVEYLLPGGGFILDKVSLYSKHTATSYPVSTAQGYLAYLDQSPVYRPVYTDRSARIYENTRVLPRAFLASSAWPVTNAAEANRIVLSGFLPDGRPFLAEETALIEFGLSSPAEQGAGQGAAASAAGAATITAARAGQIEVRTSAPQESVLVYSENYAAGWQAAVDGQPARLYRTDGTLLGVPLPAGDHQVVLSYQPSSRYLIFLGYAMLLAAAAAAVFGRSPSPRASRNA